MRAEFLPFSRPAISEEDIAAVSDVLRSGWITTGPKNAEFETQFCEYTGCSEAVALTSATAGMHLLLHALKTGAGDEVITLWLATGRRVAAGALPGSVGVVVNNVQTLLNVARAVEQRWPVTRRAW